MRTEVLFRLQWAQRPRLAPLTVINVIVVKDSMHRAFARHGCLLRWPTVPRGLTERQRALPVHAHGEPRTGDITGQATRATPGQCVAGSWHPSCGHIARTALSVAGERAAMAGDLVFRRPACPELAATAAAGFLDGTLVVRGIMPG